jgi:anti-sigma regulatory factor (Ser/Thr protein kinase)
LPGVLVEGLLDGEADDDIALVVARVRDTEGRGRQVRLDAAETAAGQARRTVRAQLGEWGVPAGLVDDLVLVTSELVTNAFVHARPPIDLRIRRSEHEIVLEVQDRALLRPRRRRPEDDDEHGRGLNIVEAIAHDWGTRTSESGKTVWCTVRLSAARE